MKCPKCHSEAAADALFCPRCGCQLPAPGAGDVASIGEQPTARAAPALRRWSMGEKVLGRYRILGELGQGGMGVVYKCFDEVGGIEVALKALPPELSHNTVEMEEVRENFRLVERLHHPNITAVKTLERDEQTGDYYLILELAEGVDLRRWRKQKGGKASLEEVLLILQQVAEALDYAHSRKIIHRDIKPANVMVGPDGGVKVLDFGLAAQIQTSLSRVSQVKYGTSGTGPYMAPEQWRGQRQDGASDQYSLAVLAYELLAGHLPFESADAVVLQQAVLNLAPEGVTGLEPLAWNALHRGLAKERHERHGSCGALVATLEGRPDPEASGRRLKSKAVAHQPATFRGRLKAPWVGALVAILGLVGLGSWYLGSHLPAEKARRAGLAASPSAEYTNQNLHSPVPTNPITAIPLLGEPKPAAAESGDRTFSSSVVAGTWEDITRKEGLLTFHFAEADSRTVQGRLVVGMGTNKVSGGFRGLLSSNAVDLASGAVSFSGNFYWNRQAQAWEISGVLTLEAKTNRHLFAITVRKQTQNANSIKH